MKKGTLLSLVLLVGLAFNCSIDDQIDAENDTQIQTEKQLTDQKPCPEGIKCDEQQTRTDKDENCPPNDQNCNGIPDNQEQ